MPGDDLSAGSRPAAPATGPDPADPASPAHRAIRSYVLRRSHFSPAQREAWERLMPRFGLPFQTAPIDPPAVFGRVAPLVLEIGFGMGDTTAEIAQSAPAVDFIGIEVHTPGVGALLKQVDARGLTNLRVIEHDARAVVNAMIATASLAAIHVFFPDPWPKSRHHKRRLLDLPFVTELAQRLQPGGCLHLATDWPDYARQMTEVVDAVPLLARGPRSNAADLSTPATLMAPGAPWTPGTRPRTRFEQRGLRLGHPISDIVRYRRSHTADH